MARRKKKQNAAQLQLEREIVDDVNAEIKQLENEQERIQIEAQKLEPRIQKLYEKLYELTG